MKSNHFDNYKVTCYQSSASKLSQSGGLNHSVLNTFNGIIQPMDIVRLCQSTPECTSLYGHVLGYLCMDFVFLIYMNKTYVGAVLSHFIKNKS